MIEYTKVCKYRNCDIEFKTTTKRKIYCCSSCQQREKRETRNKRVQMSIEEKDQATRNFLEQFGYTDKILSVPIRRKI